MNESAAWLIISRTDAVSSAAAAVMLFGWYHKYHRRWYIIWPISNMRAMVSWTMKPIKIIFHFKSSTGKNLNVCSRALCCYPKCRMQMTCRSAIAVYVCGALRLSNAIIDSVELGASQIFNCCNVDVWWLLCPPYTNRLSTWTLSKWNTAHGVVYRHY